MPNEHERAHSSPAVAPAVAPAASGSLLPRFHQLTNKQKTVLDILKTTQPYFS